MYNLGNARTSCLERGRARSLRCLMLGEGVSSAGLGTGRFAARARLAQRPPPQSPLQPCNRSVGRASSCVVAHLQERGGRADISMRQAGNCAGQAQLQKPRRFRKGHSDLSAGRGSFSSPRHPYPCSGSHPYRRHPQPPAPIPSRCHPGWRVGHCSDFRGSRRTAPATARGSGRRPDCSCGDHSLPDQDHGPGHYSTTS